jgi:apolipoprotein N-acyltransferase
MTEIPLISGMDIKNNTRERRTTACSICAWISVLFVCGMFWIVGTSNPKNALGLLVLVPFILLGFIVALYKICKNTSKWYKLG